MDEYKESHEFFWKKLVPKHEEVITKLTNLRNGIQANVKNQKEISTIFSLNGILGGGLFLGGLFLSPVTGGGSLVAAVGSAYGMAFGGLEVVNGIVSTSSINQKLNEAQECLEDHERVLKKMYDFLEQLHYYIKQITRSIEIIKQRVTENNTTYEEGICLVREIRSTALNAKRFDVQTILSQESGIYQLLKLREPLRRIMPNALQRTAIEVTTQLVKAAAEGAAKGATGAVEGAVKEAGKASAKEAGKAAAKGALEGAVKGAGKAAAKEAGKAAAKGAVEGAAKGAGKVAAKGAVQEAVKEAGKVAAKGAVEGAAKGAGKAAAKGAGKAAAKGASRGALKKIANEGSRRIARQSASKVAEETLTTSAKVMGTVAVIGIILDLKTIYSNSNDLSKMEKGKFCDQAKYLNKAIEDLEDKFDRIRNVFKVQINPT